MIKKSVLILMVGIAVAALASTNSLKWESLSLDLGQVKINESVDLAFSFTNESANPVTILNAKGSCGCTQVNYPKESIAPGTSAKITAKFKTSKAGSFNKSIRVKTSADENEVLLTFKGEALN